MRLIHQLTHTLIVAFVEGVAYCKYAVFLAQHELGTTIVFFADVAFDLLQLFPCAVAQGLKFSLRMLGGNVLDDILA